MCDYIVNFAIGALAGAIDCYVQKVPVTNGPVIAGGATFIAITVAERIIKHLGFCIAQNSNWKVAHVCHLTNVLSLAAGAGLLLVGGLSPQITVACIIMLVIMAVSGFVKAESLPYGQMSMSQLDLS
ncbi:MAG: hypothetical protein JSR46_03075 [Verrucomicrobia bacterium]|nr:hypothetical protein [Verrucomicrobiota bacterium]